MADRQTTLELAMHVPVRTYTNGSIVVAVRNLANGTREGTVGVVFEAVDKTSAHGPMVRWLDTGGCNVEDGDTLLLSGY